MRYDVSLYAKSHKSAGTFTSLWRITYSIVMESTSIYEWPFIKTSKLLSRVIELPNSSGHFLTTNFYFGQV